MKNKWLILIIAGLLLVIAFRNRWIFDYKFEPKYWENLYYHSQWNIPNSSRGIGDEGLYQYAGWRYANGDNPFDINYMVPPLGKWLYGLGAKYWGNPYLISVGMYLLSLGFYALISKIVLKKKLRVEVAILIFILNPMLIAQVRATMLDLPQMLFLLGQIYFLFAADKNNKKWMIVMTGIFLGLATGVKIGLFIPIIGLADMWYLFKKWGYKSWWGLIVGVIMGYVLSYFCYFIYHPNPIPWLRLHEKVMKFWMGGDGLGTNPIDVFRFIFLNQFMGWWPGAKIIITREWTLIFPIGTMLSIWGLFKIKKIAKENIELAYLVLISVGWIGACMTITFWPRYLIPIIPVLSLITVIFFEKKRGLLIGLVLASGILMISAIENSPEEISRFMCSYISTENYPESYRLLTPEIRKNMSEEGWIKKNRDIKLMVGSDKSECQMEEVGWKRGQRKVETKVKIVFKTREGEKSYEEGVKFREIKGEWKVEWKWNMDKIEELKMKTTTEKGIEWREVWIVPEQIQNWPETISTLGGATGIKTEEIWKIIQGVVPDKYPVRVGWIKSEIKSEEYKKLLDNVAIRIDKRNSPIVKNRWKIIENIKEIRWLELETGN